MKSNRDAAAWADVIMMLAPDTTQAAIYEKEIAPNLSAGKMLMFAHGFNIRYNTIHPPKNVDVTMIAPKAPGHRVREVFTEGGGTPCCSPSTRTPPARPSNSRFPTAKPSAEHAPASWRPPSPKRPKPIFSASKPCSAAASARLMKAGFDTLVEAGYQPEAAYFECMHEMKLIVDLIYQGGLNYMRYSISDTAEWGDYTAGPQIVNAETRKTMKEFCARFKTASSRRTGSPKTRPAAKRSWRCAARSSTCWSNRSANACAL